MNWPIYDLRFAIYDVQWGWKPDFTYLTDSPDLLVRGVGVLGAWCLVSKQ
jgi:hypothetical protein